ncbi:hypothetical protein SESBI_01105 [Sesbania bispinosa]|nr:hypothetical protein SESBI_01105 [Sesbania bispinosa]
MARAHATNLIFKEASLGQHGFCHNRPLYVEAVLEGVKVRRALIDNRSGVNIMSTTFFNTAGIPVK